MKSSTRWIEIMDTTLRDGEQTSGVAFTANEKLTIAKNLINKVKVDRIEIASARVSKGEYEGAKAIFDWAIENGHIDKIEILGFVDNGKSLDWIQNVGGQWINLLCKGSRKHVEGQLKKTPEEHIADIKSVVADATQRGINVNVYLEDWSNGMRHSRDYVMFMLEQLRNEKISRFMLPDTLGVLEPYEVFMFARKILKYFPGLHFDFHGHNDYDLSTANALAAVRAGFHGVHTSVNGLGERAGNTVLSSIVPSMLDHLNVLTSVDEKELNEISRLVSVISGVRIPVNKPIIGENVFTQTAGVHADGDKKGNLYFNDLLPERFGRKREYALGKTSGKANIQKNLEELGFKDLPTDAIKKITEKVILLGDRKQTITSEDLMYIVRDVVGTKVKDEPVFVENYYFGNAKGLRPVATLALSYKGKIFEETSPGDGMYDAFANALERIYDHLERDLPELVDYTVRIPPGGKTDALVETSITWLKAGKRFKTRGLDPDQTVAAVVATTKMLNLLEDPDFWPKS